jgi:FixJ family two-component response regulator
MLPGRKVVCVVDDDSLMLKSIRRLLEREGYSVVTFAQSGEALDYMTRNSVPLAILDIWMEQMTGIELLAHLCARSPRTHVIFITGREDRAAQAMVMQAGAFGFLIKPFKDNEFLAIVQRALGDSPGEGYQAIPTSERGAVC